jgi:hypothetical protein
MPIPVFTQVVYLSPWLPLPPGWSKVGLDAVVSPPQETGQALAGRLRQGDSTLAVVVGVSATEVILLPAAPLSATLAYFIDVQWVPAGTPPGSVTWSTPATVATAPVVSSVVSMSAASIASQAVRLSWDFGGAALTPAGANVLAFDSGGTSVGFSRIQGLSGTLTLDSSATPGSQVYLQGVMPVSGVPGTGFAAPFSMGPIIAGTPLPLVGPAITAAQYENGTVRVAWTVPEPPAGGGSVGYDLVVSAGGGGAAATVFEASASGGVAVLGAPGPGRWSVAGRVRIGPVTGDSGPPVTLLVTAPAPRAVTLGGDQQSPMVNAVLATPAGVPASTSYRAWLLAGQQVVAGPVAAHTADGVTLVSFGYAATGVAGLSVVAQAQVTDPAPALLGPRSAPVPVLATAPRLTEAVITPASAAQWRLDATWLPPADGAAIVSYTLALIKNADAGVVATVTVGATAQGSLTFERSAVDAALPYTLTLSAASANGSVTPVASTPVWFATAAFTAVSVGQEEIAAGWTAPSDPAGAAYQLRLLDTAAGSVLATASTTATAGSLPVTGLRPGGAYALGLGIQYGAVLLLAGSDGTYKTQPALLLDRPGDLAVTTDAVTGKATLTWSAVAGASGYTVSFSDGRAPADVAGLSYAFPAALPVNADLRVTVAARIAADAVTSTGPPALPLAILTGAPVLVSADYDAANVSAAWQPAAGASGYVLSVLKKAGAVAATSARIAGTSVSFPAALTASEGPFTAVVQAISPAGTGLPSNALPIFRTAWFVSADQPAVRPPSIYPAVTLARAPVQISVYLPPLASSMITVSPVGAFQLTHNADATTKDALPYVLTFAPDSAVWRFSQHGLPLPPIRPGLRTDYVTFLQAAESAGAEAWGISVLQQAISRWMPQTFAESHFYAYGLSLDGGPGTGSVDLRQGLLLRAGFADYTNVWSGDADSWLNGFGGGSPADYDIADGMSGAGSWQLSMDAFIATLTASGAMTVAPPATTVPAATAAGVADAADLFFPGFPRPFYRLFFPRQLGSPTGTGSISTAANFALASAASYTALSSAAPVPGVTTPVAYFRGRAVLRLMIRVLVNGAEVVVPLGTTVGNVLDRYGARPPATAIALAGVTLERAAGPGLAVLGANPRLSSLIYDGAARQQVRLDWSTMAAYGGPVDATSLPLLHGDRIAF